MSQYATVAQFRIHGLPAQATANMLDADIVARLVAASAVVDRYLRQRFTLPLVRWGTDITRCVCVLASADIMAVRGYSQDGRDELLEQRKRDELSQLEGIAKGILLPDVTDSTPTYTLAGPRVSTMTPRGW